MEEKKLEKIVIKCYIKEVIKIILNKKNTMKEIFFEYLDKIQIFFQNIIDDILNFDYSQAFVEYFNNFTMQDFLELVLIYFFILWIAIIIWVARDILSRSNSILLQMFSILLVVFLTPIFGLLIYFIIRPSHKKYEDDDYYEEIVEEVVDEETEKLKKEKLEKEKKLQEELEKLQEEKIKEEKLKEELKKEEILWELENITCYNCSWHIEEKFRFCPHCQVKLKYNCPKCKKEVKTNRKICPYCWEANLDSKDFIKEQQQKVQEKKSSLFNFFNKKEEEKEENNESKKKEDNNKKIEKKDKKQKKVNFYLMKKRQKYKK